MLPVQENWPNIISDKRYLKGWFITEGEKSRYCVFCIAIPKQK